MSSFKITLRKKKSADGLYPLAIRITQDRVSSYIYTGKYISIKDWDEAKRIVKKSHPNSVRLNNLLIQKLAEVQNHAIELETNKKIITSSSVKEKVKPHSSTTFFNQADIYLTTLQKLGKYNQYSADKPRINHFKEFLKNRDISFSDISVSLLERFKLYLNTNYEMSERTIINHFVVIRSIFSQAKKHELINETIYPFGKGKIQIKFPESIKLGLPIEKVRELEELQLGTNKSQHHAKNLWLFSFYTAGMRISDVLRLKWEDIQNDRLHYAMGKNKKVGSLKLPEKALSILKEYTHSKRNGTEYIFPDLQKCNQDTSTYEIQKSIASATKRIDTILQEKIARLLKLNQPLTMHIARHTFGNISGDKIPIQMLQKLYRHSSITTTIGYQSNFIHKDADEALDAVVNS